MSRRVAIGGLGTIGLSVAKWLVQADGFDLAAVAASSVASAESKVSDLGVSPKVVVATSDIPQVERPPAHLAAVLRSYQASWTHGAVVRASDARTEHDFRSRGQVYRDFRADRRSPRQTC